MKRKQTITLEELCSDLPDEIKEITAYARGMVLHEDPDYQFLRKKIFKIANINDIKLSWSETVNIVILRNIEQ